MSVNGVTNNIQSALKGISGSLFFPGGTEFASSLTIGQIIKGRVLRHYEGSRYLMDFGGQEKVVDSVVPLRTHDLIHGRVIAIGERVELQRVHVGDAQPTPVQDAPPGWLSDKTERLMREMAGKYQGKLSVEDNEVLLRAMRAAPNPQVMAVAGLALHKLGLALTPELLRAVFSVWMSAPAREFPLNGVISQLAARPVEQTDAADLQQFAQIIMRSLQDLPEKALIEGMNERDPSSQASRPGADLAADLLVPKEPQQSSDQFPDQSSDNAEFHLGRWLLNAQTDGTVGHRLGAIPVYLGDQLIEVNIAVFEQRRGRTKEGVRYRQLVFSLDMETLGHVEVTARIADQRLRLRIVTEDSEKTDMASRYLGELRGALKENGWQIDEAIYETRAPRAAEPNTVVGSVIEHLITQDSLSRLM